MLFHFICLFYVTVAFGHPMVENNNKLFDFFKHRDLNRVHPRHYRPRRPLQNVVHNQNDDPDDNSDFVSYHSRTDKMGKTVIDKVPFKTVAKYLMDKSTSTKSKTFTKPSFNVQNQNGLNKPNTNDDYLTATTPIPYDWKSTVDVTDSSDMNTAQIEDLLDLIKKKTLDKSYLSENSINNMITYSAQVTYRTNYFLDYTEYSPDSEFKEQASTAHLSYGEPSFDDLNNDIYQKRHCDKDVTDSVQTVTKIGENIEKVSKKIVHKLLGDLKEELKQTGDALKTIAGLDKDKTNESCSKNKKPGSSKDSKTKPKPASKSKPPVPKPKPEPKIEICKSKNNDMETKPPQECSKTDQSNTLQETKPEKQPEQCKCHCDKSSSNDESNKPDEPKPEQTSEQCKCDKNEKKPITESESIPDDEGNSPEEIKSEEKSEQEPEQKPEQKTEHKTEQKTEQKSEQKPEQKTEHKSEQKSEQCECNKNDSKPATEPDDTQTDESNSSEEPTPEEKPEQCKCNQPASNSKPKCDSAPSDENNNSDRSVLKNNVVFKHDQSTKAKTKVTHKKKKKIKVSKNTKLVNQNKITSPTKTSKLDKGTKKSTKGKGLNTLIDENEVTDDNTTENNNSNSEYEDLGEEESSTNDVLITTNTKLKNKPGPRNIFFMKHRKTASEIQPITPPYEDDLQLFKRSLDPNYVLQPSQALYENDISMKLKRNRDTQSEQNHKLSDKSFNANHYYFDYQIKANDDSLTNKHHIANIQDNILIKRKCSKREYNRKKQNFFDDDSMDDQEISTRSDDSWFKRHFYVFLDPGPSKKQRLINTKTTVQSKADLLEFPDYKLRYKDRNVKRSDTYSSDFQGSRYPKGVFKKFWTNSPSASEVKHDKHSTTTKPLTTQGQHETSTEMKINPTKAMYKSPTHRFNIQTTHPDSFLTRVISTTTKMIMDKVQSIKKHSQAKNKLSKVVTDVKKQNKPKIDELPIMMDIENLENTLIKKSEELKTNDAQLPGLLPNVPVMSKNKLKTLKIPKSQLRFKKSQRYLDSMPKSYLEPRDISQKIQDAQAYQLDFNFNVSQPAYYQRDRRRNRRNQEKPTKLYFWENKIRVQR